MKILGLDLGVASIGWCLIEIDNENNPIGILGMGSRIIPFESDKIATEFSKGKGETSCSIRTAYRQLRRQIDRWQLRRDQLKKFLQEARILTEGCDYTSNKNPLDIWGMRASAANKDVTLSLNEIAYVLLHINQRRGYKHAKSDIGDSKQTEYVQKVNDRYNEIKGLGITVGEYFYSELEKSEKISQSGKKHYTYRIKEKVFPRKAYEEEVDQILSAQQTHYPDILTDDVVAEIKHIIFYQRPLKSCKNLVSYCDFERKQFKNSQGILVDSGPKVSPRTSPLSQVCKIYEAINNITLINQRNKNEKNLDNLFSTHAKGSLSQDARKHAYKYQFTDEERKRIFEFLDTHEKMSESDLLKLLGLKKSDGFKSDKALGKGIQGNTTKMEIVNAFGNFERYESLLRFDLITEGKVDFKTGEVTEEISPDYQKEPLYMLWHTLYSIDDKEELFHTLREKFGIMDDAVLERLYALDFVKSGYANKSAKFMRKLLPWLIKGYMYSKACERVNINHSNSLTKEENSTRELSNRLIPILKGELRQPIVEKVLNQMVNLVNSLIDRYGEIEEVRVELARELKQNKEQREKTSKALRAREDDNKKLVGEISQLNILPTKRRIQKMRMLKESGYKCIYCGTQVSPYQFIEGHGYDIEHIIPRSRLFDDSFSNKVCSCRECNASKGGNTAYDFMKGRSEQEFSSYCERVETLYKDGSISKGKRDRLFMSAEEIPEDFIERDLRETQYISKKAMEILRQSIRNVYASSGSVTDFFRHVWGYDTILQDLNLSKYEKAGLTESVKYEHHGQQHETIRIKEWSKRKDHRHHAIDALVVALTRQGYVQRLNSLNAKSLETPKKDVERVGLDKWAAKQPHFPYSLVKDKVDEISISFKAGKKVSTPGKRYTKRGGKRICVQTGVSVPRAALHKETVYGCINIYDGKKTLKFALQNLDLISEKQVRDLLQGALESNGNDVTKTVKMIKKNPIVIHGKEITEVGCFRKEIVVKYPIEAMRKKDLKSIIDPRIREIIGERFKTVANDKEFERSLKTEPLYSDLDQTMEIKTVRCFTGIQPDTLAAVRKDENDKNIGFSQTRNNHHVAFYKTSEGKDLPIVVSLWECVKRKRFGLPLIVTDPDKAWDKLMALKDQKDIDELAAGLPPEGSKFVMSLQRNEMVVLGMSDDEWIDAINIKDMSTLNRHLYRVWKLSSREYAFRFHTDTNVEVSEEGNKMKLYYLLTSTKALEAMNPHKVKIDILGNIISVDD